MFIAHAPAGYLLANLHNPTASKTFLLCAVIASILPDADLLYFYLIDHRQTHHHHYWFHVPFFWCVTFSFIYVACRTHWQHLLPYVTISFLCIMLHMALDSIVAPILWMAPFDDTAFQLHHIIPKYHWWVWNFVLHWSFGIEILICVTAFIYFRKKYY